MQQRGANAPLAIGLVVLGIAFLVLAIFYFSTTTHFLADSTARHYKHGILALVLAALCLIGANFARRSQA